MSIERTSLYFCSGNSDKEYHATLEASGDGYVVNFSYGRRGSTLQSGSKTSSPVSYEKAKKIFDALVQSKITKGYSIGEDGTPYAHSDDEERTTDITPQLLNPIDDVQAESLLDDPRYWMQQKFDGKRMLIRREDKRPTGINRRGLTVALPAPMIEHAKKMSVDFVIDGEAIGDVLHAFDLISMGGISMRDLTYAERLRQLENLLMLNRHKAIRIVATAKTVKEKRRLYERLRKENAEGVVFKKHDAPYMSGRPASGGPQLKFKFYASASCLVSKINVQRSVGIELIGESGLVDVGNVTIPPNHLIPPPGAIIEVRYLYCIRNGALFQPTYLGPRDDLKPSACKIEQLKYKPENAESDDDA